MMRTALSIQLMSLPLNASPRANDQIGWSKKISNTIASKKELGWLNANNKGPLDFSSAGLLKTTFRKKIKKDNRTQYFKKV